MNRYTLPAVSLHWLMALALLFMWLSGFAMTRLVPEDSAAEDLLFGLHISSGVTVVALLLFRILIRLGNRPPALPTGLSPAEKLGSHVGHALLYLLPVLVVGLGWAEVDLGGHGVKWFGVPMPKIFPTIEASGGMAPEDIAESLHRVLAYIMLAVTAVHIAAVAKHRFVDGHDVLGRMSFGERH